MLRFEKLTVKAQEAVEGAIAAARDRSNQAIDVEHLILGLLKVEDSITTPLVEKLGVNLGVFRGQIEALVDAKPKVRGESVQPFVSPRLGKLVTNAEKEAAALKDEFTSTEHLILAAVEDTDPALKKIFSQYGLSKNSILNVLKDIRGAHRVVDQNPEGKYQ